MNLEKLAKLTNNRVQNIGLGELYDILPKASEVELLELQSAIKNKQKRSPGDKHKEIGYILMMIIYRLMQNEVKND